MCLDVVAIGMFVLEVVGSGGLVVLSRLKACQRNRCVVGFEKRMRTRLGEGQTMNEWILEVILNDAPMIGVLSVQCKEQAFVIYLALLCT